MGEIGGRRRRKRRVGGIFRLCSFWKSNWGFSRYAWMGWCFEQGVGGCPVDLKSAKQWLCMAAEEDLVLSMTSYAKLLAKTDPKRYEWLGKV